MAQLGEEGPRLQIDRIVYLASLISDKNAIDTYLDPLRAVTARLDPARLNSGLDSQDTALLAKIEADITDYLLHREPLRTFTFESLQQRLYERVQAPALVGRLRLETAVIFVIAMIVAIGAALLPLDLDSRRQSQFAALAFMAMLYLGGTYLFYSCLKQFSPSLRSIYRLFCASFVIGSATGLINFTVSLIFPLVNPKVFWYFNLLFLLSYILMYGAARRLARLQGISSISSDWRVIAALVLGSVAVVVLMPQGRTITLTQGVGITAWLCMAIAVLALGAAGCLYHIWKRSTERYRASSYAMFLGMIASFIAWSLMAIYPFLSAPLIVANISNLFSVFGIVALVRAGYSFNKLSRQ